MNLGEWKLQLVEVPGVEGYRVYLYQSYPNAQNFLTPDGLVRREHGALINEAEVLFTTLTHDQLHAFAEALSEKGFKTRRDAESSTIMKATENHLSDMRKIVFKKLGINNE